MLTRSCGAFRMRNDAADMKTNRLPRMVSSPGSFLVGNPNPTKGTT